MRKHTGKTTTQRDRRDETIPTAPVVASATIAEPSAEPAAAAVVPSAVESSVVPSVEPTLGDEALAKRRAFIEALARQAARELFAEAMAKR